VYNLLPNADHFASGIDMISENWLGSYIHFDRVGDVLNCIAGRLSRGGQFMRAVTEIEANYEAGVISGRMWLERINGESKLLYTTGRLTSEIVR
jgi:acyl carrier protein phosphodiesterase